MLNVMSPLLPIRTLLKLRCNNNSKMIQFKHDHCVEAGELNSEYKKLNKDKENDGNMFCLKR